MVDLLISASELAPPKRLGEAVPEGPETEMDTLARERECPCPLVEMEPPRECRDLDDLRPCPIAFAGDGGACPSPSRAVFDAERRCLCPTGDSRPLRLAESRRMERVGEATDTSELELEAMDKFLDCLALYVLSCVWSTSGQLACSGDVSLAFLCEEAREPKTRTFFLAAMSLSARSRAAASLPAAKAA